MASSNQIIDEIRIRVNIVDIIREHVSLTKKGTNHLGLCPFHTEKTPSFTVSETKQFYHCFGCGESGNAFQFLMKFKNLSFREALIELGKRVGIEVDAKAQQKNDQFQFLLDIYRESAQIFHHTLTQTKQGSSALSYILNRTINDDSIQKFFLGASPEDWTYLHSHLTKKHFSIESQVKSGLVSQKSNRAFDYFRNRLIFPIYDELNRIIAFGGRVLDDSLPKYLNSAENYYFKKRQILYGLNLAKDAISKSGFALFVEGYIDVIMAHQYGVTNTVAPLGTGLTEQHIQKIKRYTNKIILVFDGDTAGEKAMIRGLAIALRADLEVLIVSLPDGLDPCDYLLKHDAQTFQEQLNLATPALDFRIEWALKNTDLNNDFQKKQMLNDLFAFFNSLNSEIFKEEGLKRLSKILNISVQAIQSDYLRQSHKSSTLLPFKPKTDNQTNSIEYKAERFLLFTMLNHPDLYGSFKTKLSQEKFQSDFFKELYNVMDSVYQDEGQLDVFKIQEAFQDKDGYDTLMDAIFNKEYEQTEPAKVIQDCLTKLKLKEIKLQKLDLATKLSDAKNANNIELERELLEEHQFLINEEDKIKQR